MDERISELMDILMLIVILATAIPTGYLAIVKTNREMQQYQSPYEDKNTSPKFSDDSVYTERNAVFTKGELLLMTAIQDDGIKGPHAFTYSGDITDVTMTGTVEINGVNYTNVTTTGTTYVTRSFTPPGGGIPTVTTSIIKSGDNLTCAQRDSMMVYGDVYSEGVKVASSPVYMTAMTSVNVKAAYRNGYSDVNLVLEEKEKKEVVMHEAWGRIRSDNGATGYIEDYIYDLHKYDVNESGEKFLFSRKGIISSDGTVN